MQLDFVAVANCYKIYKCLFSIFGPLIIHKQFMDQQQFMDHKALLDE